MGIFSAIGEMFHEGGWMMYIILASLVAMIAIIVERIIYLRDASVDKDKLLSLIKSQVASGNVQGAIKVCSGNPAPVTRIVQAGLQKYNRTDNEVQAAMDETALRELPRIKARTPYLAMLANFAVLAGLVGTILGMIKAFKSASDAEALGFAISEALNCTFFGILSSLVGLVGFGMLTGKTTKVTDDINEIAVQVVNMATNHRGQMNG